MNHKSLSEGIFSLFTWEEERTNSALMPSGAGAPQREGRSDKENNSEFIGKCTLWLQER